MTTPQLGDSGVFQKMELHKMNLCASLDRQQSMKMRGMARQISQQAAKNRYYGQLAARCKCLYNQWVVAVKGKEEHKYQYFVQFELEKIPPPPPVLQLLVQEAPYLCAGVALFFLCMFFGYLKAMFLFIQVMWLRIKPFMSWLYKAQSLASLQTAVLIALYISLRKKPQLVKEESVNDVRMNQTLEDVYLMAVQPEDLFDVEGEMDLKKKRSLWQYVLLAAVFLYKCVRTSLGLQLDILKLSWSSSAIQALGAYIQKEYLLVYFGASLLVLFVPFLRRLEFEAMWYGLIYIKIVNLAKIGYKMARGAPK